MSGFETILEGLVTVLLVATIVYAAVLNRKLNTLRQGKSDFEAIVMDLNEAIERAEQGTVAFRDLSDRSAEMLDDTVKEARALRGDLRLLIDRGGLLADRLSVAVKKGRELEADAAQPASTLDETIAEEDWGEGGELPPETQEKLRKLISTLR